MPTFAEYLRPFFTLLILQTAIVLQSAGAEPEAIKIGATLALTGKLAYLGQAEKRGFELALKELNGISGGGLDRDIPRIELITEDNGGDPKNAVSAVQKLLSADQIQILFSAFTHISEAIAPIAAKSGAVLLYTSSSREIVKRGPRIFRDSFDAGDGGVLLGQAIVKAKPASVAILSEISEVCSLAFDSLRPLLETAGIPIKDTAEFNPGEKDFKSLLLRLRAARPAAMVICAWRDEAEVMRQMKTMNLLGLPSFQFFAPFLPESDTPEIRQLYAENRTVSTWYGYPEQIQKPAIAEFYAKYRSAYGEDPRPDSIFAYDDLRFLAAGARRCRKISNGDLPACVAAYLQTESFAGLDGPLKFDQNRLINRAVFPIQFTGGKWKPMGSAE